MTEQPPVHYHGDQSCDPSEEAAIEQMERDEGPIDIEALRARYAMPNLTREQEIEIIVRGMNDRQLGETDKELAGRIVDDFAHSQPKYLGPEHVDSLDCWCGPYPDTEEASVIIHRKVGEA